MCVLSVCFLLDEVCVLFIIPRRWMVDSDGARPDDDEYDRLDYIRSVLPDQQCAHPSTIGLQDISNEGTISDHLCPILQKFLLNVLTCIRDNQHVRPRKDREKEDDGNFL